MSHRKAERPYEENGAGCWIWQWSLDGAGYSKVWDRTTKRLVVGHRYYYEQTKGPIPEGMHIDHLCGVRACINPDHLEAVTVSENNRRSWDGRRAFGFFLEEAGA